MKTSADKATERARAKVAKMTKAERYALYCELERLLTHHDDSAFINGEIAEAFGVEELYVEHRDGTCTLFWIS